MLCLQDSLQLNSLVCAHGFTYVEGMCMSIHVCVYIFMDKGTYIRTCIPVWHVISMSFCSELLLFKDSLKASLSPSRISWNFIHLLFLVFYYNKIFFQISWVNLHSFVLDFSFLFLCLQFLPPLFFSNWLKQIKVLWIIKKQNQLANFDFPCQVGQAHKNHF